MNVQGKLVGRRSLVVAAIIVALVSVIPSWGTLGAGLISDDGAVFGNLSRRGAFGDWFGPEYDLRSIRFWRPLVSTSLGLQLELTGVQALPMRCFNLFGHVMTALLCMQLVRQLGGRLWAAAWIGCLVGLFPYQGGTVTWIVGRVDSQCVPLVLGALVAVLSPWRGRALIAGLCMFLAIATKEVALVTPLVALILVWARGRLVEADQVAPARAGLIGLGVAFVVALVWRRLALGLWLGGYPGGLGASFPNGLGAAELGRVVQAAVVPEVWLLGAVLLGLGFVLADGNRANRGFGAGLALLLAGLVCQAPLLGNLAAGDLTAFHVRTLMLADAVLCVGLGVLFVGPRKGPWLWAGALVLGVLTVQRGQAAWEDTHEWAAGADLAGATVAQISRTLSDSKLGIESSLLPVLTAAAPATLDGAYVLKWGLADRFRAPFATSPRPVWPWRLVYELCGPERASATTPRNNLRWPFNSALRTVPPLLVTGEDGAAMKSVELTADLVSEPGLTFNCSGAFPGARFEVLLFTEVGYTVGRFGGAPVATELAAAEVAVPPFGGSISLRDVLVLDNTGTGVGGTLLWQVIALAADFGATEAYLEFRAVDDARGQLNRPVASSQWIRLHWAPELRDVLLPKGSF